MVFHTKQQLADQIFVDSIVPGARLDRHGLFPRFAYCRQVARVIEVKCGQVGVHLGLHSWVDGKPPIWARHSRTEGSAAAHRTGEFIDKLGLEVIVRVLHERLPALLPKSLAQAVLIATDA